MWTTCNERRTSARSVSSGGGSDGVSVGAGVVVVCTVQWPVDGRSAVRRRWQSEWESSRAERTTYVTTPNNRAAQHWVPSVLHAGGGRREYKTCCSRALIIAAKCAVHHPSSWPLPHFLELINHYNSATRDPPEPMR